MCTAAPLHRQNVTDRTQQEFDHELLQISWPDMPCCEYKHTYVGRTIHNNKSHTAKRATRRPTHIWRMNICL